MYNTCHDCKTAPLCTVLMYTAVAVFLPAQAFSKPLAKSVLFKRFSGFEWGICVIPVMIAKLLPYVRCLCTPRSLFCFEPQAFSKPVAKSVLFKRFSGFKWGACIIPVMIARLLFFSILDKTKICGKVFTYL